MKIYGAQLHNTIFSLDKDLLFNEVILLRIIWGPYTLVGFGSTLPYPPALGGTYAAAGVGTEKNITAAAFTSATISNLTYYLAIEQDINIVNSLRAKTAST